ncbi:hypothetical protein PLESTB_001218900 [Pleodorina starrii]|uniref:Uncharacterized protein n=1 Tax=Pleodorina starrii TaxID=330485 RepID=A0A9W6BSK1_9CHLO|nr:hypothetical protein PLESTB_001218700 [Pleodorina starrii]GLC57385.1 hypothetical protein PLESTB_001218900 [Pleodorina starrii]
MAAAFATQSVVAGESIRFKSLSEAALDKGPLTSRLVHGAVWSRNRNGAGQQGLSHASDGFKAISSACQAHAAGRAWKQASRAHSDSGRGDVDAADSCWDALPSCRLAAHAGGAFIHNNAAYEESDGDDNQPSGADRCGSLHAAFIHDAMRSMDAHDNGAFQPSVEGDADDVCMSQAVSSDSPTSRPFARRGVLCVMLYDNGLYESGALQQQAMGPSPTTSQLERTTIISVAGPAAATCLLHCAQFGCCERQQEKQQQQQLQRRRTAGGGVSVPEQLRPRFMRSTAASRAKAVSRDA